MPFGQDLSHKKTVPYVFVNHRPVGGFSDIKSLERTGTLEPKRLRG
jgi:glutaredoxin